MITSSKGSLALTRFSRAATRGKIANLLFPTYLVDPADELPLALATTTTRLSSESRQELSAAYGARVDMLTYEQSCVIAYDDFIRDASRFVDETGEFSDSQFLLQGEEYRGRASGGSRKKKTVAAPRKRTARVAGATEGIKSILQPIKPRTESEEFVLAGVAAPLPSRMSPNDVDRCATVANDIANGIEKAKEALQNGGTSWRPSSSARFEYLFPKTINPKAPERRFMLTASMLDPARMRQMKKKRKDEPEEPTLAMQAGIEFEARALGLVAEKYGFQMVPDADQYSRCLPSNPTYMAATPDGLTTTGVVVELKFVTNFVNLLTQQGMVRKYDQHWHQIQGQLTVFELPLALLVFYSVDRETDDMCSMEFWVQRDEHYLQDNKARFDLWLEQQRKSKKGWRQDLL